MKDKIFCRLQDIVVLRVPACPRGYMGHPVVILSLTYTKHVFMVPMASLCVASQEGVYTTEAVGVG